MQSILANKKLILASKSPRRKEILEKAGFVFEVRTKDVEESYDPSLKPYEVAEFLAKKKAQAFADQIKEDEIVLCADTIVVYQEDILGKPENPKEAFTMLSSLSDDWHEVITGVCLFSDNNFLVFHDRARVKISPLREDEINYYIESYKPYDKAGGYGIQEWIGFCKIEKIEGTFPNIMGLPMEKVYRAMEKLV